MLTHSLTQLTQHTQTLDTTQMLPSMLQVHHLNEIFNLDLLIDLYTGNTYSQQTASVPPCADCAGANPFVNPYDPSHQPGYVQPAARPVQQQQQSSFNYNNNNNIIYTTERPRSSFFPPGKLNLNRFETGFNFDFES